MALVWSTWPEELVKREFGALEKWKRKLASAIDRYKFLQFEFFRQWNALKAYANERNISIIGDIPIFVAYDSADTWANPKNYYLDEKGYPTVVAGVPPDYFSQTGSFGEIPYMTGSIIKKQNINGGLIEYVGHSIW